MDHYSSNWKYYHDLILKENTFTFVELCCCNIKNYLCIFTYHIFNVRLEETKIIIILSLLNNLK